MNEMICSLFGILFIITGLLFYMGKLINLISAWKNMPEEEKEKINIVPLCKNIGSIIILSGIIFLMRGYFFPLYDKLFSIAMITWLIIAGLDVYYISKSKKFKKQ